MSLNSLTKILSIEYVIGLCIALAAAYAAFSAAQASDRAKLAYLERQAEISRQDHDAIVELRADVRSIKESVERIERQLLMKKEATLNGN